MLAVLAEQEVHVLASDRAHVLRAFVKEEFDQLLGGSGQTLNKANGLAMQNRFKVRNWAQGFQESGVSGVREVPDDLDGCIPGSVELEMFL